jgi:hypothetical protein
MNTLNGPNVTPSSGPTDLAAFINRLNAAPQTGGTPYAGRPGAPPSAGSSPGGFPQPYQGYGGPPSAGDGQRPDPMQILQALVTMTQNARRPGGSPSPAGAPPGTYPKAPPSSYPNESGASFRDPGGSATRPSLPSDRPGYVGIPYGAYQGADGKWYVAQ